MKLDLSNLKSAIESLERALQITNGYIEKQADNEIEVLKSGVIQNFEFTYELCWKFMKRWLDYNYSESSTAGITRKQLFRLALENLLITDFDKWLVYHELRNKTSHTYDANVAEEIFSHIPAFLADAKRFYQAIEERND